MPTDDTDKTCGLHALDPLIHDDCPYCTQIRLAARDEEISRLTTAWHVEMETEAAMRAEVERLRSEVDECRRLLREAVNRLESDPVWWVHSLACEYWCEQAAQAAGGDL